ncbi:Uncharacterised protein [Mycobacteroides abscessus subsp. abscessus]|nr:Uncharacterised protein [Mycobacteroides abscessus subsp. abscessus]
MGPSHIRPAIAVIAGATYPSVASLSRLPRAHRIAR